MAKLIKCPFCKYYPVSDGATKCPNCNRNVFAEIRRQHEEEELRRRKAEQIRKKIEVEEAERALIEQQKICPLCGKIGRIIYTSPKYEFYYIYRCDNCGDEWQVEAIKKNKEIIEERARVASKKWWSLEARKERADEQRREEIRIANLKCGGKHCTTGSCHICLTTDGSYD